MPKAKQTKCPVCGNPVGNDPHELCLAALAAEDEAGEEDMPPMPCPACGKPMVDMQCQNPDCENRTGAS